MAYTAEHGRTFDAYYEHGSRPRQNTSLVIHESLRCQYPGHHVTKVNASDFDIFGFVADGNGEIRKDDGLDQDSTKCFNRPNKMTRGSKYRRFARIHGLPDPTAQRKEEGAVFERVAFGRWTLTWNSHEYLLYRLLCAGGAEACSNDFFVLSPRDAIPDVPVAAAAASATTRTTTKMTSPGHPDTDALLQAVGEWSCQVHEEIGVFDDGYWSKDAELLASARAVSWDDVVQQDSDLKASLRRDVLDFFGNEELYRSLGVPWKRGIILHGEPGNGKTLTLKAIIRTLWEERPAPGGGPVPTLYVKALKSQNDENSIRDIFQHARKMAPCLLVFEDLDSIVTRSNRSYFLNEVDGLADNDGILMVGSTNHLSRLDSSITKRPSRFDRKYHFDLPSQAARRVYCDFWRGKILALPREVDFPQEVCEVVAGWTEGFSFAYMKELFMSAMLLLVTGTHEENEYEADILEEAECGSEDCCTVVVHRQPTGEDDGGNDGGDGQGKDSDKTCGKASSSKDKKCKPRTLPEVDVPVAVEHNLMLSILKSQAKALLADMDNSGDKSHKTDDED